MFNVKRVLTQASFSALAYLLLNFGNAGVALASSTGTSHIGITKVASLRVAHMSTEQLYADQSSQYMRINACVQSGGQSVPYRLGASSLSGQGAFQVSNPVSNHTISYEVLWSDSNAQQRLVDSTDISDVLQVNTITACDQRTLSIQMDAGAYNRASSGSHTDILSLIFIIE